MGIWDYLKESITMGFREIATSMDKEFGRVLSYRIEKILSQIKRQLFKELLSVFMIIISIGLLSVSAVYFMIEYLSLNKTLSFLIIGIIIMIIGILIKLIK